MKKGLQEFLKSYFGDGEKRKRSFVIIGASVVVLLGAALFVYNQTKQSSVTVGMSESKTYATEGIAAFNSKQFSVARDIFSKEIASSTNPAEKALGYFNRATAEHGLKNDKAAIADFKSVVKENPKYLNAWLDLGILEQGEGNVTQALKYFQQVLVLKPSYAPALFNVGIILYRQGSVTIGRADISNAIAQNPKLALSLPSDIKLN